MVNKARQCPDGTLVENPHFEQVKWTEQYDYCICGKDIEYNFMAVCVETGKSFIVGSKCIETVCLNLHFDLKNKCYMCKNRNTVSLTAKFCSTCKSLRMSGRALLGFGKYAETSYLEIINQDRKYCEWVLESATGHKAAKFAAWYEEIKDMCLTDSDTETDEPVHKTEPTKIYLNVPYSKKDELKQYKIRWDAERRLWYIYSDSTYIAQLNSYIIKTS